MLFGKKLILLLYRFIHTQRYTYIYKWCSLNLFRYFEYIIYKRKQNMQNCTNRRHWSLLITTHIYHYSYYYEIKQLQYSKHFVG